MGRLIYSDCSPTEVSFHKKEFSMKNVLKFFGIIAILALIGFSVISCVSLKPSPSYVTPNVIGKWYNESGDFVFEITADGIWYEPDGSSPVIPLVNGNELMVYSKANRQVEEKMLIGLNKLTVVSNFAGITYTFVYTRK